MVSTVGAAMSNELGALRQVVTPALGDRSCWPGSGPRTVISFVAPSRLTSAASAPERSGHLRREAETANGEVPGGPHADAELVR